MSEDKPPTMKESLAMIRRDLQAIIESQASSALITRARYDALIKVGFSKSEALEIIKARGIAL